VPIPVCQWCRKPLCVARVGRFRSHQVVAATSVAAVPGSKLGTVAELRVRVGAVGWLRDVVRLPGMR
jgi:hypothetical protein